MERRGAHDTGRSLGARFETLRFETRTGHLLPAGRAATFFDLLESKLDVIPAQAGLYRPDERFAHSKINPRMGYAGLRLARMTVKGALRPVRAST